LQCYKHKNQKIDRSYILMLGASGSRIFQIYLKTVLTVCYFFKFSFFGFSECFTVMSTTPLSWTLLTINIIYYVYIACKPDSVYVYSTAMNPTTVHKYYLERINNKTKTNTTCHTVIGSNCKHHVSLHISKATLLSSILTAVQIDMQILSVRTWNFTT
jgi:hypothetical protein